MVVTSFNSFLLIVLILVHATYSPTAFSLQAMEKRVATMGNEYAINVNKEISGAKLMGDEVSNRRVKGRKMMIKEIEEEGLGVEKRKISGGGNCKHRKNGKCKILMRNRVNSDELKEKMAGFTAFSADYHVPKSHPPKHN